MKRVGRPRIRKGDCGTQELQSKRENFETTEILDAFLLKQLITDDQHRAGIKFRWLYTVNFGLPNISSYDISELKGIYGSKYNDEKWLSEQFQLYKKVVHDLKRYNADKLLSDICIYNVPSLYLARDQCAQLMAIRHGLDILDKSLFS